MRGPSVFLRQALRHRTPLLRLFLVLQRRVPCLHPHALQPLRRWLVLRLQLRPPRRLQRRQLRQQRRLPRRIRQRLRRQRQHLGLQHRRVRLRPLRDRQQLHRPAVRAPVFLCGNSLRSNNLERPWGSVQWDSARPVSKVKGPRVRKVFRGKALQGHKGNLGKANVRHFDPVKARDNTSPVQAANKDFVQQQVAPLVRVVHPVPVVRLHVFRNVPVAGPAVPGKRLSAANVPEPPAFPRRSPVSHFTRANPPLVADVQPLKNAMPKANASFIRFAVGAQAQVSG